MGHCKASTGAKKTRDKLKMEICSGSFEGSSSDLQVAYLPAEAVIFRYFCWGNSTLLVPMLPLNCHLQILNNTPTSSLRMCVYAC